MNPELQERNAWLAKLKAAQKQIRSEGNPSARADELSLLCRLIYWGKSRRTTKPKQHKKV